MLPRGLRNKNPLNIRHNGQRFQGEIKGNDKQFKTFISMEYGYRAAFVILGTYISRKDNTIEKIIRKWAPACENNTNAYICTVERMSKVARTEVLTLSDGDKIIDIVAAMSFVENGVKAVMTDVKSGFLLQYKIKK
ncbi:MAG: structural protein P5 [Bacteroidales bacterium]|jgi:hypothetical protein